MGVATLVAVRAAEEGDRFGRLGVGVAFETRPGAALGVPEVALQTVRVIRVGREHPAEQHVLPPVAGVQEESLAQIHVVTADPFGDGAARADALEEVHAGDAGRDRTGDVRFGQADGRLDPRRRREAGEEGRLRRVGSGPLTCPAGEPHLLGETV